MSALLKPVQAFGEASDEYSDRCEYRAMDVFYKALAEFLSKVQDAEALTDLRKEQFKALREFISDYTPSRDRWEEDVQRGGA